MAGRCPTTDAVLGSVMAEWMGHTGALLLGRRTYQDFCSFWPKQPEPNPFTTVRNDTQKDVASTTLAEPLPWMNSTLLVGDAAQAVAKLKAQPGRDLAVLCSGALVQSLLGRNLVDGFALPSHPLILGSGRRLFRDGGAFAKLRLTDSVTTTIGVVIATYTSIVPSAEE